MNRHHEAAAQHQQNDYIREADKDHKGNNDNWTKDFIHDHYKPGHGSNDSNYDDNVRKTAAEAWARIKTDLRDGEVVSENASYWDRSKAGKDYLALQSAKDAGGAEGKFAEKVLTQIEKLQRNLHEDNEMQKLGFSKFDHILGADSNGRLDYQSKGADGKLYSEKHSAGGLGDVSASTRTGRRTVTEGTESNYDGTSSNVRTTDTIEKAPNGKPKGSHTEYSDEDGKRDINGRKVENIKSIDKQFNEETHRFDYRIRTKDGQDISYSTDRNDKNATFVPTLPGQAAMQGKLDQSMPSPAGGKDLRNEQRTSDGKFEGTFNDGWLSDTGFKRTDVNDTNGHLLKRTVEYDGGKLGAANLNLKDQSGNTKNIQDVRKVETVFDPKTGRYQATYTDGRGTEYHATLSADMKSIEKF